MIIVASVTAEVQGAHQNGRPFSTPDCDIDAISNNCAIIHGGAW